MNYGDQFMKCPECGGTAEAECVDVGVGLYIKDEYECSCGYNSAADGRANVGSYDDWFPEADDGWISLDGFVDPPAAPAGFVTQVKYDSYMGFVTDYRLVRAA